MREETRRETTLDVPLSSPSTNRLETLPSEVLDQITAYLPATASIRLHRCSKTLASRIALDQNFWRHKLLFGYLVGYLWDLNIRFYYQLVRQSGQGLATPEDWDWKRLAKNLMRERLMRSDVAYLGSLPSGQSGSQIVDIDEEVDMIRGPLGMLNRQRIWRMIQEVLAS